MLTPTLISFLFAVACVCGGMALHSVLTMALAALKPLAAQLLVLVVALALAMLTVFIG